ncbi:hypothetical protein [Subtercola sp. YIM 133946]|uniref:hypothetical protein n=1 Tax=Subtercola sp. YIM 133946 TaxID=3118909 RepID=UPI002F9325BF
MLAAVLAATVAGLALASGAAADAQPANCGGPDAPPACHHTPPAPPKPTLFESRPFSPIANIPNEFFVSMHNVKPAAVAGLADGSETAFQMSISCTNGFFRSGPMQFRRTSDGTQTFLLWNTHADTGEASGTCYASTWDSLALGVAHSIYTVESSRPSGPVAASWDIEFGLDPWAPSPQSN